MHSTPLFLPLLSVALSHQILLDLRREHLQPVDGVGLYLSMLLLGCITFLPPQRLSISCCSFMAMSATIKYSRLQQQRVYMSERHEDQRVFQPLDKFILLNWLRNERSACGFFLAIIFNVVVVCRMFIVEGFQFTSGDSRSMP